MGKSSIKNCRSLSRNAEHVMSLNIAILGTRGIPNNYGGYEQIAGFLASGLLNKGYHVTVYNSHNHPYKKDEWNGIRIVHRNDPEHRLGTMGQFFYDLNCIRHARNCNYDIILFLGYTSSSVFSRWYPRKSSIIYHMDGLEWKRAKYSLPVRKFLKHAERLAVRHADFHIADSVVIQSYLENEYGIHPKYIPYGAIVQWNEDESVIRKYQLNKKQYYMVMARMEPENNIEMILDGFTGSKSERNFLVVGNTANKYGNYLIEKYRTDKRIVFAGALFEQAQLHSLRTFSSMYFHGHSVGGTNPSLLEAMASRCTIAAHDNGFNRAVLGNDAYYFKSSEDVLALVSSETDASIVESMVQNNTKKIQDNYRWEKIVDEYDKLFKECLSAK